LDKAKTMTPTQRSMAYIRKAGGFPWIVEHWNSFAHIRQDLFQFADILAVFPNREASTYIQVTSGSNVSARKEKILANKYALQILNAGNVIEIHGWRKVGARGKRKLWENRIIEIKPSDFASASETVSSQP